MYARVIVDIAHSQVDRLFDYIVPPEMDGLSQGCRVMVPFGRGRAEGFVVEMAQKTDVPENKLKAVIRPLEDYPALLPEMVTLALQMQARYQCLLVDALRCLLPAQMRGGRVKDKEIKVARLAVTPQAAGVAIAGMKRAPKQAEALNILLGAGEMDLSQWMKAAQITHAVANKLAEKGYVELYARGQYRRPAAAQNIDRDEAFAPNEDQRRAIAAVTAALPRGGAFLLHGVTGCGKTEVYMHCAARALKVGRGVIIMVPEIALTPQMVSRFTARFGDMAAVLHSRLSPGERYDEWKRIRSGEARLVVGARSAVFAPVERLGLIVVDEEHEMSYRSEQAPRYDAVEVAGMRRENEGATLVLGSATPSVERYWRAGAGEFTLLELPVRIGAATMPHVEVVDMRRELQQGNRGVMSEALVQALTGCLARGEQAIIMLNRRGHSTFVSCRNCGHVVTCDLCDISMTYHRMSHEMRCHYCGERRAAPEICPACGSRHIRFFGDGTQKLHEELQERFPNAGVLRMDADTTRGKDAHLDILRRFGAREAQILVGTQMIAKGLDFPNVTLVGIVAVDGMLHMGDYRSAERAFQLMAQVAGRAGRGDQPGWVVLQTYSPDHYAVQFAAKHDYAGFFGHEIEQRRATQYPPFTRIIRAVIAHEDDDTARAEAQALYTRAQAAVAANADMAKQILFMDMTPAPVQRLRAFYRYQVIMKAYERPMGEAAERILHDAARETATRAHVAVECNPVSMA